MNGISSTLKDEIKKTQDSKQKEKIKFIAAILATNLLVAILCYRPANDSLPKKIDLKKTLHSSYQMIVVPLNTLIPESSILENETPITLVSTDKKIIAERAFLHELVKTEQGATHFKIEISERDLVKVSEFIEAGMIAVPYVEIKKQKVTYKRGSKYEITL